MDVHWYRREVRRKEVERASRESSSVGPAVAVVAAGVEWEDLEEEEEVASVEEEAYLKRQLWW